MTLLSRILLCSFVSLPCRVVKTVATKNYKQCCRSFHVATSKTRPYYVVRRLFATQPEALIVDYDRVKEATGNSSVLIVDVREPEEVKEHGKIPNSINIPLGTVTTVLSSMSDKEFEAVFQRQKPAENTEMIFYCMIGKRSGMAQQNALNLGYKNAKNYLGSWTDWAAKTKN